MTKAVSRPGSRGGSFWIDKQGQVRYGEQPRMSPPVAKRTPVSPESRPAVPTRKLGIPHYAEFGEWSPEATRLHLRGALSYGDAIATICRRYRALSLAGLSPEEAARRACGRLDDDGHQRLTRAIARIGRQRAWDDDGMKRSGDPEGTAIPAPQARLTPFVLGALAEGLPLETAQLLASIVGRAGDLPPGENLGHAHLAGSLLERPDLDAALQEAPGAAPLTSTVAAPSLGKSLLLKAVMRPGSRGGHVYWWHGKLRYGTPPLWHPKGKQIGSADIKPTWLAPGRLARRILAVGHRILYLGADQRKKWGEVIAASGEMLSVLPDDAQVYDLLHTVVVPAERVLRVVPDTPEGMGHGQEHEPDIDEEEDAGGGGAPGGRLAKSARADDAGGGGPDWSAEDLAPWPDLAAPR